MAVVPRQTKKGTVYWIATFIPGRKQPYNRRSGTDKRVAERLDSDFQKQVKAGTFNPGHKTGATTVASYADTWGTKRKNRSAEDDRRWLRKHVLTKAWFASLRMDEVRPKHVSQLVRELREAGELAEKSIGNAFGVVRTMFRDAHIDEIVLTDPCVLRRGEIKRGKRKKERAPYSKVDAWTLAHDERIPEPIRVFNALMIFGGLRLGEAAGRRWKSWDRSSTPLGCLTVDTQYDDKQLKTDDDDGARPRQVPVHPELERILDHWWSGGYELYLGRRPTDEDFIVPNRGPRAKAHQTRSSGYKAFRRACTVSQVKNLSVHSLRHTAITFARRGGARKEVFEKISHNAKGDIVDQYTHWDWLPLCEAVLCLDLDPRREQRNAGGTRGNSGGATEGKAATESGEVPGSDGVSPGFDSRRLHDKTAEKTRGRKAESSGASRSVSGSAVTVGPPPRLVRAARKTSPHTDEGVLARRLVAAWPGLAKGDRVAVDPHLKRAAKAIGRLDRGRL